VKAAWAASAFLLAGCAAGYHGATARLRTHWRAGQAPAALADVNRLLGVPSEKDLPKDLEGDRPLYLLERAVILQALGEYRLSERDFEAADKRLEVLSLTAKTADTLAAYLYSAKKTTYRATATEKALVNVLNLVNYLAEGDLNGAKVEARRLRVFAEFLRDQGGGTVPPLGSYLAGFAFEQAGEPAQAMRFYGDAVEGGLSEVGGSLRLLHERTGAADRRLKTLLEPAPGPGIYSSGGDVLVICAVGDAPVRRPENAPIYWALEHSRGGPHMTAEEWDRAQRRAASLSVKVVRYPGLEPAPPAPETSLSIDGAAWDLSAGADVGELTRREYEKARGGYLAAAVARLITRAVVGRAVAKAGGGSDGNKAGLWGFLLEGALTLNDRPDTRSWSGLPGKILMARRRLPMGEHRLTVRFAGPEGREEETSRTVTVAEGGYNVIFVTDDKRRPL
jgi:hypothetical protein